MTAEQALATSLGLTKTQKKALVEKIQKRFERIFWHKDFDDPACFKSIIGPMPGLELYLEQSRKARAKYVVVNGAGFLRACYEEALLTRDQEFHLFRRYNFHKYCAKNKFDNSQVTSCLKDLKAADAVRRSLASANVRLAIPIVRKYNRDRHYEDLVSESYYLILRAIDYFDFNRGIKFSTYGTWVIIRTMQRTARQWHEHDNRYLTGLEKCDFNRESAASEASDRFQQIQNKELIDTLLSCCTPRERGVLKKRFFHEKTLQAIADEMGLSKERVRQIETVALEKISLRASQLGLTIENIW